MCHLACEAIDVATDALVHADLPLQQRLQQSASCGLGPPFSGPGVIAGDARDERPPGWQGWSPVPALTYQAESDDAVTRLELSWASNL
jgi:hypothetical protein